MRQALFLLLIASINISSLMAQDTIISYFDSQWKVVSKKKKAKYYRKEYYDNDKKL